MEVLNGNIIYLVDLPDAYPNYPNHPETSPRLPGASAGATLRFPAVGFRRKAGQDLAFHIHQGLQSIWKWEE